MSDSIDQVDPSLDDLEYRVLRSIRRIVRRISAYSRQVGRDTGLGVPQMLCMRAIEADDAEEVTVARVADATHLSRSTVSTMVEKLVRASLVSRVRSVRDRRRVHLGLTEQGRERLRHLPRPLEERFLARLQALPEDQRERILGALEQVVEMMDAENLDAAPMLVPGPDIK